MYKLNKDELLCINGGPDSGGVEIIGVVAVVAEGMVSAPIFAQETVLGTASALDPGVIESGMTHADWTGDGAFGGGETPDDDTCNC